MGSWNWLTVTFAALFVLTLGWSLLGPEPPVSVARFPSPFLDGQAPTGPMELTPDGLALVYVGPDGSGGGSRLWIRRWDDLNATPVPGTDGGRGTEFALSPDGDEVAFATATSALRVVSLEGGPTRTLADSASAVSAWAADGWVYFSYFTPEGSEIRRVQEADGAVEPVIGPEGEVYPVRYEPLPGGRTGVFQIAHMVSGEPSEIWALDLETGRKTMLTLGNSPRYVSTGHLLFGTVDGGLMAAPIDAATAEFTGLALPVEEGLRTNPSSNSETMNYSVSQTGTLIFRVGGSGGSADRLFEFVWVTRSGDATPVDPGWTFAPGQAANAGWRLSPSDDRVVFGAVVEGNREILIKDLPNGSVSRITFSDAIERMPRWAPDGQSITFRSGSIPGTPGHLLSKRADGTGEAEVLFDERNVAFGFWSPDGKWLVLRQAGSPAGGRGGFGARDILALHWGVDSLAIPLVANEEYMEQGPALSPDGRWLAYSSNETGRNEVHVRPFPDVNSGRWQVSVEGGIKPLWGHSGGELFFVNPRTGEVMGARFEATQSVFSAAPPETLFTIPPEYLRASNSDFYDVTLDDERFLMARPYHPPGATSPFVLVQNWFEELRQRLGN